MLSDLLSHLVTAGSGIHALMKKSSSRPLFIGLFCAKEGLDWQLRLVLIKSVSYFRKTFEAKKNVLKGKSKKVPRPLKRKFTGNYRKPLLNKF